MPIKVLSLLLFCLGSLPGFGQAHYLQARLDGVWNVPHVEVLRNTGGYAISGGRPRAGLKVGYLYFNRKDVGVSVGVQVARKQYVVREERRQATAVLQSAVTPRYYTLSLPLAFEYRGNPFSAAGTPYYRKRFFSLSAGAALAYTKEAAITLRTTGAGSNFQSSLLHSDDFSFSPVWGYEIFLHPAYNFRFRNGGYAGLGLGFTLSPAPYASLSVRQQRDGQVYEGRFQPRLLNYLSLSFSYQLPLRQKTPQKI